MTKGYQQRKAANARYLAKLDNLTIRIPGGQKETVASAAADAGESVNGYVIKAILDRMGLDSWPSKEE